MVMIPSAAYTLSPDAALQLFLRYKATGDHRFRNDIINGYLHMLKAMCAGYEKSCSVPQEDLVQEAWCGFAEALEQYDPAKGARLLRTYCCQRAKLRVLDHIMQEEHGLKVSTRGHRALTRYNKRLGPLMREYEGMNIPVDVVLDDHFPAEHHGVLTLLTRSYVDPEATDVADDERPEMRRDREIVKRTLDQLPEPNKTIVTSYYSMTPKQFGKFCQKQDITAAQVDRIIAGTQKKIRRALGLQDCSPAVAVTRRTRIFPQAKQLTLAMR